MERRTAARAFTLIELMIVVAIIAIIAAIAIPNLLESRMQANEADAVAALKQYATAQMAYKRSNYARANGLSTRSYCTDFTKLGGPNAHVKSSGSLDPGGETSVGGVCAAAGTSAITMVANDRQVVRRTSVIAVLLMVGTAAQAYSPRGRGR